MPHKTPSQIHREFAEKHPYYDSRGGRLIFTKQVHAGPDKTPSFFSHVEAAAHTAKYGTSNPHSRLDILKNLPGMKIDDDRAQTYYFEMDPDVFEVFQWRVRQAALNQGIRNLKPNGRGFRVIERKVLDKWILHAVGGEQVEEIPDDSSGWEEPEFLDA